MNLPAVKAFTTKGKVAVNALQNALRLMHLVKGKAWAAPPPLFHEDPRHFTTKEVLFFAYKYYFNPPFADDADGQVVDFFKNNPPIFKNDFNKNAKNIQTVTITAAGDLMPYEWIQKPYCPHLWDAISDDFFSSDITFANLETPIDLSKPVSLVPEVMLTDMLFNGDADMLALFNGGKKTNAPRQGVGDIGFDILSTANNHALDMGENGVYATIDFLNKNNIQHVGTAKSAEERLNFPIIEKNGIKLAFMAYTYSMNKMTNPEEKPYLVNHLEVNQSDIDLKPLENDVILARQRGADLIILSLHYGNAYQAYPGAHIVANTRRIFEECGVDIILGGHPHNIQPMAGYDFKCPFTGYVKRGFVLFAFGDFVAYDIFTLGHLSVYLKLTISKCTDMSSTEGGKTALTSVEAVPVYANGDYKNKNTRDLRLIPALKYADNLDKNHPPFMTDWNVQELRGCLQFYFDYFAQNLGK
jgi:poly-gamma-glutamate capsule biosynthesis protein CapA/YwtB (metallophosphatase superfamily)